MAAANLVYCPPVSTTRSAATKYSIPDSAIEEIRARTDLADLVASYGVQVRHAGSSYKACCPFHHEKTPSFNIQPSKGFYHCFGCGESGDCFTFVMKQEGLTFVEAVKKLAAACGVAVEEKEDPNAGRRKRLLTINSEAAEFFRRCLKQSAAGARARDYLKDRALGEEICDRFMLGYVPEGAAPILKWAEKYGFKPEELDAAGLLNPPRHPGDNWYNQFGGRLAFAIRDRAGRVVGFSCRTLETDKKKMRGGKYVNTRETDLFRKSSILYAFDLAAPHIVKAPNREAIVCEGQIDVIRCHACGFATAVASEGTAFTAEHVAALKKCADCVVLILDGDEAGYKASVRTGGEFLAAGMGVRVASLPPGDDPDTFLRTQGADAMKKRIDEATSVTAFQIRVLLAKETAPDSPAAKTRTARAIFATLAKCASAVQREAMLAEAAQLLALPIAALKEDFGKCSRVRVLECSSEMPPPAAAPASSNSNTQTLEHSNTVANSNTPTLEHSNTPTLEHSNTPSPPPVRERAFCEFLFDHEGDAAVRGLLAAYAPRRLFAHDFTRSFVAAWREGGNDAALALRPTLDADSQGLLDAVFASREMSALSELPAERIAQDFLRKLWQDAVKRERAALADDAPDADGRRLEFSVYLRRLRNDPWERAAALMETLAKPK